MSRMMSGNCNRSSSNCIRSSSNCVRRTSSAASNFKASRQKVAPPKRRDVHSSLMQNIHRIDTLTLSEKLKDTETPDPMKYEIKREIETRQHDQDSDAAAIAVAVIDEHTPQRAPQPARISAELIEKLYHKRGMERAKALAGVIELLKEKLDHDDLKRQYFTLLDRCLNGVKKGYNKEVQYSLKVIGLLSNILDCQDRMSEIYRELLVVASTSVCQKKLGTNTTKMLECLGVVGFFGSVNAEETQAAMKVIWDFMMNLKSDESSSGEAINRKKILLAAINSWLFLLSSMEGWRLNQTYWRGAISFFMSLLDNKQYDTLVHKAASAALSLIFEINCLDIFWNGEKDSTFAYSELQETLRKMILKKLSGLNMNVDAVKYFENPIAYPTVCEKKLVLTSWYQVIQLEFLRSFLGNEFENYMAKEEKLQSLFEFRPYRNDNVDEELYEPTVEKIMVNIFMPERRDPETMTAEQREEGKREVRKILGQRADKAKDITTANVRGIELL